MCDNDSHRPTPISPFPFFFFYSQALKILPACLEIFKFQGFLTGTGVTNQNRVGGEKRKSRVARSTVCKPPSEVPHGVAVKGGSNYAVCAAGKGDLAAPPASFVLKYSMREERIHLFEVVP